VRSGGCSTEAAKGTSGAIIIRHEAHRGIFPEEIIDMTHIVIAETTTKAAAKTEL
jgi:hypothetical protein